MIHQPYYIFQGIAFSGLSIYFYMNNFNYWAIGFSVLLAIGSFSISTEDPKNKKDEKIKNSVKTKLTNKKVSDTIKRSLILMRFMTLNVVKIDFLEARGYFYFGKLRKRNEKK